MSTKLSSAAFKRTKPTCLLRILGLGDGFPFAKCSVSGDILDLFVNELWREALDYPSSPVGHFLKFLQ
jgi:hypothetical protein